MPISAALRHHYATPAWREARARVMARSHHRCEWCDRPGAETVLVADDSSGVWFDARISQWRRPPTEPGVFPLPESKPMRWKPRLVQIGVAHMNHVAGDDRDENLAALCRRCHLLYDGPHHRATHRLRREQVTGQLRLELEP